MTAEHRVIREGVDCRVEQILAKDREESMAKAQAEAAFADMLSRYGDRVFDVDHHVLRELFAAEGQIGYVINFGVVRDNVVVIDGGFCLSYDPLSTANI